MSGIVRHVKQLRSLQNKGTLQAFARASSSLGPYCCRCGFSLRNQDSLYSTGASGPALSCVFSWLYVDSVVERLSCWKLQRPTPSSFKHKYQLQLSAHDPVGQVSYLLVSVRTLHRTSWDRGRLVPRYHQRLKHRTFKPVLVLQISFRCQKPPSATFSSKCNKPKH